MTTSYRVHTGNLFGVASEFIEKFNEIASEYDCEDHDYAMNPAFAGAWAELCDKEAAEQLQAEWEELLPAALDTMSAKWREEYESDLC